jgi:hypothetical protein
MADNPELKKLNKNVEDAVNILKLYVGNSAQIKNMNEKQREAISKWFDVTEKQEEAVKKQRAFTERERDASGKFKKKSEGMFMDAVKGIGGAVTGIFVGIGKTIGATLGGIAKGITTHIRSFFGAIKSHFLGLFGEESEWFDMIRGLYDSVKGFVGWFARGFINLFRKTPGWAGKMLKVLENMYSLQIKQMKMEFLTKDKKKMTFWSLLGGALFLAAALVGGWIRKKLMGIELMLKGLKIGNIWKAIKLKFIGIFTKLRGRFGWIDKLLKSRAFGWLKRGFTKLGEWGAKLGKWLMKVPILGKLLRGLKFGFKILGWPITILFGIIDFIKGWMNTEGDWRDKLAGGLKSVFHGLLDLPLEILGWAWDKLMGLFGVESEGTGAKLVKWFDDLMGFIFEWGPIGIISDLIKGFTTGDFAGAFSDKIDKIKGIFGNILDLVENVWNSFLEWAIQKAEGIPWVGGKVAEWVEGMRMDTPKKPVPVEKNLPKLVSAHENKKVELQKQQNEELKQAVKEGTEATKASRQQTEGAVQAMTAISQGGGGGSIEQRQIPDEVDNYPMLMKCHNGGAEE